MHKYDGKDKLGLAIVFGAVLAFGLISTVNVLKRVYRPTHKLTDFSEASEEEKKALSIFYDSDIISEGKYFDLKFTYFEPCTDEAVMEIVKKTDADLGKISIETWSENEEFISGMEYGKFDESILFWKWRKNSSQQYLRFLYGNDFLNDHDIKIKYNDDILIKVKIWYDEYTEEEYEVHFDLDKNFKELERRKNNPITSMYDGQLATYYYGLLLSYDKERWFEEVNELIDRDKNEYLDYTRILKTDVCRNPIKGYQDGDEQSLYQFNDKEYAEYQRIVQRAEDKGLFKYEE